MQWRSILTKSFPVECQSADIPPVNKEKAGRKNPAFSSPNSGDSYFMNQSDKMKRQAE
jgi:hypothetical protein